MTTIAVIEDEARIASFLREGLEAQGFTVEVAADGAAGLELASRQDVDLVILDLKLPVLEGEKVLRHLRARRPGVPIVVLTAKDAVVDRVANLEAGADDYVTKPFSFAELLARVNARLRRRDQGEAGVLSAGGISLEVRSRIASVDGRRVELTAREFALLETFMRHPGQILSRAQLLDLVWGHDDDPGSNVDEVYVGYLRKKLRPDVIETVRGAGYRLRP